jgi:hypothetical protein
MEIGFSFNNLNTKINPNYIYIHISDHPGEKKHTHTIITQSLDPKFCKNENMI